MYMLIPGYFYFEASTGTICRGTNALPVPSSVETNGFGLGLAALVHPLWAGAVGQLEEPLFYQAMGRWREEDGWRSRERNGEVVGN